MGALKEQVTEKMMTESDFQNPESFLRDLNENECSAADFDDQTLSFCFAEQVSRVS